MSGVFGGNELAQGVAQGADDGQGFSEGLSGLRRAPRGLGGEAPHEGHLMIVTLQSIERELRRIRSFTPEYGRQFTRQDGGQAAGGNISFVLEGPRSGNDWYVERIAISAAGVSGAGQVALFQGQAIDESMFIDVLGALTGASPSRGVLDGHGGSPYFIYGGGPVTVAVLGVVAGTPVNVRLQGREVLSGADPALRGQDNY